MEMHIDAMIEGTVILVDDLLATGGTSARQPHSSVSWGRLLEAQFLIELEFLNGRKQLDPTPVISFLKY
jgi:adenine phosphoribosyltransferase